MAKSTAIVPLVVIGPPVRPVPAPTEVTVPLGSSPEGITAHSTPLDTIVSPFLLIGVVL